ncbi:peptidoglycan editing factor PgeF [Pseudoalteromonas sp. T1lg23B]|uniref:peptidoglycan editing factor PgeF n=1 Tax=Pseudoalteromonas sp. T1lg23B TaxID=2077097 RepID=UPI000CF6AC89|nr:peptidoglycan editing factor PgeF [Pseudoalteromonas sp. T1lg23B]
MILPNWPIQHRVSALSTTRLEGYSAGPFDSFNLGYHVGDSIAAVDSNHQRLREYLPRPAQWLEQVHGAQVFSVTHRTVCTPWPKADALYTRIAQQPLAVMTADCLPILLANEQGTEVAAIHGGWRPLVQGVIANTLRLFDSSAEQLYAWLGPAIGPSMFEVGSEVKAQFCAQNAAHQNDFYPQKNGKYLADIYSIARRQLARSGVVQVFGGQFCTVSQSELFFSYRRDGQTGRMASLIWRN